MKARYTGRQAEAVPAARRLSGAPWSASRLSGDTARERKPKP